MKRDDIIDARKLLAKALENGPDKNVLCFALHHCFGYTFGELGQILGVGAERARDRAAVGGRTLVRLSRQKPAAVSAAKSAAEIAAARALRLVEVDRRNKEALEIYRRDFNNWSELKTAHKFLSVEDLRNNISASAVAVIDWAEWKEIHEIDAWVRRSDIKAYARMCGDKIRATGAKP